MSAKQAKRARQELRRQGIEPDVDAKRRVAREYAEAHRLRVEAAEKFRREHPEEYEAQQRASRLRGQRAMQRIGLMLGALGGLR